MLYTINGEKHQFSVGETVLFSIWAEEEGRQGALPFEVCITEVQKARNEGVLFTGYIRCHDRNEIRVTGDFNHKRGTGFLDTEVQIKPAVVRVGKQLAPAQFRGH